MAREEFDLIIIGSGPGGYVAGIRAGQLGLKTAVVERDPKFGGTCTHRGCIPTKALLHTAAVLDEIHEAKDFGIEVAAPKLDIVKAQDRKQKVVDSNAKGIEFLFKKNKVTGILRGTGRMTGPNEVEVEGPDGKKTYGARFVMIATGSVPRDVPIAPVDGERILNSDHILELKQVPKSLAVLGAGAVGTEFASIYRSFGSEVTLIEMLPRVLPIEDEEVSAELQKALRKRGIEVMTGTKLQSVERTDNGVRLKLEGGKKDTVEAEMLLVAIGRRPVTENLGLEALGVELERGYVKVNPTMQTAVPHIYAIGDVINTPWLAHVASAEGILAVEHMAGRKVKPLNYDRVPSCTYCEPEVASVGLTEAKAKERGYDVGIGKFPLSALGKARILGKTAGFVKIVRDKKYDEVLGIHIIGAHATDLIAEACVTLQMEGTNEELMHTMHAHPTLSEAVMEAAHAAQGEPIHI
ncbi:MAG TPA: dihydrolipoyl dehydrogenase [Thermoanaerobaculia bacterium]